MMTVTRGDITGVEAKNLLDLLSDTLAKITGNDGCASFVVADVQQQGGCFAIARHQEGEALGCGACSMMVRKVRQFPVNP